MLKVLLIVVQGKPEGKSIPVTTPLFVIGRGEECHLRPNSDEVSRRHAEITVKDEGVSVRDLGSRNGTRVNGKLLKGPHTLKSGELLQVGPLTFAVAIPEAANASAPPDASSSFKSSPNSGAQLDDVPNQQIDAWLISDNARPTPDRPSGVYDGETITINSYQEGGSRRPKPPIEDEPPSPFETALDGFERPEEGDDDAETVASSSDDDDNDDDNDLDNEHDSDGPDQDAEFRDDSNPFHTKKQPVGPAKEAEAGRPKYTDTSSAADDILKRMLDRRRSSK